MGGRHGKGTFLLCGGSLRGSSRRGVWRGLGGMLSCRGGDVFRRSRLRLLNIRAGGGGVGDRRRGGRLLSDEVRGRRRGCRLLLRTIYDQ
jgi:hypothetical protein